jgi:hypothetical protein
MNQIELRSERDSSVFVVSMTNGDASVSAQDDVDQNIATIASRKVRDAMRNSYSPAMGEPIAFAVSVATQFLQARVVTPIKSGNGELEQSDGESEASREYGKPKRKLRKRKE